MRTWNCGRGLTALLTVLTLAGLAPAARASTAAQKPAGGSYLLSAAGGDDLASTACGAVVAVAAGGRLKAVHTFRCPDGSAPVGALLAAPDGLLYGETASGGAWNAGTLFRLAPDGGRFEVLYAFRGGASGAVPSGGLVRDSSGALYGATANGGRYGGGTVFRFTPGDGLETLYSFAPSSGSAPTGRLLLGQDGRLYGALRQGGSGGGAVFRIDTDGFNYASLHLFSGSDGAAPAALVFGGDGALYGLTSAGGDAGQGALFRLLPDGRGFAVLHAFTGCASGGAPCADGANPVWLVAAADGTLYGTTAAGGDNGLGTVFGVRSDGSGYTLLYSYSGREMGPSAGLVAGASGGLFVPAVERKGGRRVLVLIPVDTALTGGRQEACTNVSVGSVSDRTVCQDTSVSFSVSYGGTNASVTWQLSLDGGSTWPYNINSGVSTSGGTSTYTHTASLSENGYKYRAVVNGDCGGPVYSNGAKLTVEMNTAATDLETKDQNGVYHDVVACQGSNVTFSTAARGTGPFTFAWSYNGNPVTSGVTSDANAGTSSLAVDNVQPSNAGTYSVTVTGTCGGPYTPHDAVLDVNTPPAITTQPVNTTASAGGTATFTTAATGKPAPSLQWQVSSNSGSSWVNVDNYVTVATAGTASFTQFNSSNTTLPDPSTIVTGSGTSWTSSMVGDVIKDNADGHYYTISAVNSSTSLVLASPYMGASDSGAAYTISTTGTSLTVPANVSSDGNEYRAQWSNACAIVESNAAVLTVTCPTITLPSSLPPMVLNTSYTETLVPSGGTAPFAFAVTAGALPTGLSLGSNGAFQGTPTAAGTFSFTVTATDSNQCTGSQAYTVTVGGLTCSASATVTSVGVPVTAAFTSSVSTTGPGTVTYAWTFGDGGTSTLANPTHTYTTTGPNQSFGWSLTVTFAGATCTSSGILDVPGYSLSFKDDYGTSQFCLDQGTGNYAWRILTGVHAGAMYTGRGLVQTATNGTVYFSTFYGDANRITFTYYPTYHRASGKFVNQMLLVSSSLSDANTANDPYCGQ